uniref:Putative lipase/esterase n=1 Tax=Solibacter usitatus (strain Ellin6076) TaxID=234267 RepID=Q01ZT5_SOLUE
MIDALRSQCHAPRCACVRTATAVIWGMPEPVRYDPPSRLAYGKESSQFIEFHRAAGPGPHPLAIMIHGGFWRARYDLHHAEPLCAALAAAGFTTANLEYRRVGEPGGGWPGTFDDVTAAVAFARDHAPDFGADSARTFVLGHSAGGHLALWVAAEIPSLTRAVALAPVADLPLAHSLALSNCAVGEFLGGAPGEFPARYAFADPARPTPVPRLLIHGDADTIVPIELSRRFAAPSTLIEIPGADHFAVIDPTHAAWRSVLHSIS